MNDCEEKLRKPIENAFGAGISIDSIRDDCRVTFPFVRSDGDHVSLYVKRVDKGYEITDAGETAGMLFSTGVNLDTTRRKRRAEAASRRFDLDEVFKEIRLTASEGEVGQRLLDAFQAVQWVAFLEYTGQPQSMTQFKTRVADYLDEEGWDYRSDQQVEATSEPQTVDFEFTGLQRPTYMDSIHANSIADLETKCRNTAYKWIRIRPVQESARFISIVDDDEGEFSKEHITPIVTDSDAVVQWTNRDTLSNAISP